MCAVAVKSYCLPLPCSHQWSPVLVWTTGVFHHGHVGKLPALISEWTDDWCNCVAAQVGLNSLSYRGPDLSRDSCPSSSSSSSHSFTCSTRFTIDLISKWTIYTLAKWSLAPWFQRNTRDFNLECCSTRRELCAVFQKLFCTLGLGIWFMIHHWIIFHQVHHRAKMCFSEWECV